MKAIINSCSFTGLNCQTIQVQADISAGMPQFNIVGLGGTAVKESRERVRSSIKNSQAIFPVTRKTINLAPSEIPKQGSHFDLPIAVSILLASDQISPKLLTNSLIIGELSLHGEIMPIQGVLAMTQYAQEQGFKKIFLPASNASEASFIHNIEVIPINNLKQFISYCNFKTKIAPFPKTIIKSKSLNPKYPSSIIGLHKAKRALAIAAAGGHNLLLSGAPGCGKTILARIFHRLLPPMNNEEILETTKIYSIAGLLPINSPLIIERPFREVHHSTSRTALIGGGNQPYPGEISLAHNGTLFLDEISEFPRSVLESLRQPLEDGKIQITRSRFSINFPSDFTLIATTNPCPCGYAGTGKCKCPQYQIQNYQKKLSGPLLDRFDIFLQIEPQPLASLQDKKSEAETVFQKIYIAHQTQSTRFSSHRKIHRNSQMKLSEIQKHCQLSQQAQDLLNHSIQTLQLSNRAHLKVLKLARTIADMDSKTDIEEFHIAESLQYRSLP